MNSNKYIFDKNIYYLEDEKEEINNLNKKECKEYTINNNYQGFTYKGDNNKCLLFNSHNLNNKIENYSDNYDIYTYIKTKDVYDIKIEDQLNSFNFFDSSNNYGYLYDNKIYEYNNIDNINQCMDNCIKKHNNCNSIMFLKEKNKCNFYNKKIMKNKKLNKKFENYDIYTLKKKKLSNEINLHNNIKEDNNIYSNNPFFINKSLDNTNESLHNTNYSECINIKKEDNMLKQINKLNIICKEKYGYEYIFDNNVLDKNNIINCDNGKKIKCKLNFNNDYIKKNNNNIIEHFNSINNSNKNNNIIYYFIIFIFIFIFYIKYFI